MIFIILMFVCVVMAILSINNKKNFWNWLALGNAFTAINCLLSAQYGLCIIVGLMGLAMLYLPGYIKKSFM